MKLILVYNTFSTNHCPYYFIKFPYQDAPVISRDNKRATGVTPASANTSDAAGTDVVRLDNEREGDGTGAVCDHL